ncbi:MAG: HAMP domain-containing sensor histidine kinase [Minisyncoccia bacterium]
MKLGTKINLVLVTVVVVTLTIAFWIIINIEGKNLKEQVVSDAGIVIDILRIDIERMFSQIQKQEARLQGNVDQASKASGVKYITVNDVENKYIAATNHAIVGQKIDETNLAVIAELKKTRSVVNTKRDEGEYYEIERHIPVFINIEDSQSDIISVIEIEVVTRSKNATDVRESEKLIQDIALGIEQNTRAVILAYNEDMVALRRIVSSVAGSNFFNDFVIFNNQLEIIANTSGLPNEFANDPTEYKQIREDVFAGKYTVKETDRLHNDKRVIMRVVPITSRNEKTGEVKIIGLIETHILKESYETRVNELKIRMLAVGIVFTAVLVIVLAVILERKVVGPIRRYSVVAKKIADGDFSQTVEHTSNDEIGRFGQAFNSMVVNLRELDKLKSDFISVAAHQLRTPLSGVKWVLKLLLDGDLGGINDDQKGMLKRGYETNEKMIQLVNDLLNVSRIENGKFGYRFERNDFMKLLNTLVENTVLPSKERNIEVILENRAGMVPEFLFDPEKLLIALQNIVDNAMKYTLPGGRVTIVVEKRGDYIEVKVTDTGVGIPKADIAKLFSKFFRAANVIHLQTDGSGLGLFIVKSIIMRHGGQIWVDSVEGKGTTITVVVPVIDELLPKENGVTDSTQIITQAGESAKNIIAS